MNALSTINFNAVNTWLKREIRVLKAFDYLLALMVVGLSVFGVLMLQAVAQMLPIYAALPGQQRLYVVTGALIMLVMSLVDYRIYARFYIPIYVICLGLLAAVLIIGPDDITGTARWIFISLPGLDYLSIQPSEFAKLFLIITLASFVNRRENINRLPWLMLYITMTVVPVVLVARQPSLSASMVLLAIGLVILFVGGLYFRTIIISAILALPAATLLYFDMLRERPIFITQVLNPRQWQRVQTFLYPVAGSDEFMQMELSLHAIGRGGLYGRGFMASNRTWVIHGHNDFVFSVAAEQFGFVGSMTLLAIIGIVIIKCFLIAYRAEDDLGRYLAAGVAGMLLFQAFVNVSVVTGILPNTGMPFPFVSSGGTHMWTHMAAIGIVLNVGLARNRTKVENEE